MLQKENCFKTLIMAVKNSKNQKKKAQPKAPSEKENILKAHEQAELDIEKDPDISIEPEKGDDLDEGELARLEGEK